MVFNAFEYEYVNPMFTSFLADDYCALKCRQKAAATISITLAHTFTLVGRVYGIK